MKLITAAHGHIVLGPRADKLAAAIAPHLAHASTVLDIGTGDGRLAASLLLQRPDLKVQGLDVLVRDGTAIPVQLFDGKTIPLASGSVDHALLIDVLHHADEPEPLLQEAVRVSQHGVILKDHLAEDRLDHWTLSFMDWVGNSGHGVSLPYRYLSQHEWDAFFKRVGMRVSHWAGRIELYPAPPSLIFGRGLHFMAVLTPDPGTTSPVQ